MAHNEGEHVMLSYNHKSKDIVRKINDILKAADIRTWMDEDGGMKEDIYESMAEGVEKASVICCFMTPNYQESVNCKLELIYAQKRSKQIIPCMLTAKTETFPASWLGIITGGLNYINIRDVSEDNIREKAKELIDRIKQQSSPTVLKSNDEPTYLFELIKYKYLQNSRIQRIMNSSKSFPIEDSYINLAIVETKEQQQKEKKLRDIQNSDIVISTFEEIYGTKTGIDAKSIFEKCKDRTHKVLVLGRAGIGKSTFCQYVVYQWANRVIWSEYDLVIFIPLRSLTTDRYPLGVSYTLIDLIKKQYFFNQALSEKEENVLKTSFDKNKVLWLLDGYDEIAGNIPAHLENLIEQLLNTTHHILTSRPYAITLSHDVKMEIIGFTDNNITNYVKQFFDSVKDELENASDQVQKLLTFLKQNPNIWGVAHIPVNLELICTLWCDTDWSEIITLTMTTLYDKMTEWLCKRYLTKRDPKNKKLVKDDVYTDCEKELTFLETLAFHAMENKSIILKPDLLRKVEKESNWSLRDHPDLLNIGILKSLDDKAIGNDNDREKNHYFVHLSFQEYFAARFLVTTLQGNTPQDAIQFIKDHKYNRRFSLMLTFASGLLTETNNATCMDTFWDTFWDTILGEPLDLVGIRHMQIVVSCLEETGNNKSFRRYPDLMNIIIKCLESAVATEDKVLHTYVQHALQRSPSIVNDEKIMNVITALLQTNNPSVTRTVMKIICELPFLRPQASLVSLWLTNLQDTKGRPEYKLCVALGKMGKNATTTDVIKALVTAVANPSTSVRIGACLALREMGEKAATNDAIKVLTAAVSDADSSVREHACDALGQMGERAATDDVIKALVTAVADPSSNVRQSACRALGGMGKKAETKDVIKALLAVLADPTRYVRWNACIALGKIGEKAAIYEAIKVMLTELVTINDRDEVNIPKAFDSMVKEIPTNEFIEALVTALADPDCDVRQGARQVFCEIGDEAAISDVIKPLLTVLVDSEPSVRRYVCDALGQMGERAANNDVINALTAAVADTDSNVREGACYALGKMGEKAATSDVIKTLIAAVADPDSFRVRMGACQALGGMGEKAVTDDTFRALLVALGDPQYWVRSNAVAAFSMMGKKVARNDVIQVLLSALRDSEHSVREGACEALGQIGEKAATDEVVKALLIALGDSEHGVRCVACDALGKMGEKAATSDVIKVVITAVADPSSSVRKFACEALGQMGEKAATEDAFRALLIALVDLEHDVRWNACEALGKMGERAATSDVIKALIAAIVNPNSIIREDVCKTLGKMGEKAATDDVIRALLIALVDLEGSVRTFACEALGQMSEKAATVDVIRALFIALGDPEYLVKSNAVKAFRNMDNKAAKNGVIEVLLPALADPDSSIRQRACIALSETGEKAATDDVIKALLTTLGDSEQDVREEACKTLGKMGEKAPTSDVINGILCMKEEREGKQYVLQKVLNSLSSYTGLDSNTLSNLLEFCRKDRMWVLGDISIDNLIKVYLDTGMTEWCSIILLYSASVGVAITVCGTTVQVYENDDPKSWEITNSTVRDNLIHGFVQEIGRLHALTTGAAKIEDELTVSSTVCNVM